MKYGFCNCCEQPGHETIKCPNGKRPKPESARQVAHRVANLSWGEMHEFVRLIHPWSDEEERREWAKIISNAKRRAGENRPSKEAPAVPMAESKLGVPRFIA